MVKIQIIPFLSAVGLDLGIYRDEVHRKIGKPDNVFGKVEYYQQDLAFSVHYDQEDNVEYIEVSKPDTAVTILLEGIDIFNTPVSELIVLIEGKTLKQFNRTEPEIPYSYIFPELELSFWRPTLPEHDLDEDGKYFETVGVGVKGYYSS